MENTHVAEKKFLDSSHAIEVTKDISFGLKGIWYLDYHRGVLELCQ